MLRPDGTVPEPPLADADTHAVTVAALRAAARLTGEPVWAGRADDLRDRVTRAFLPDVLLLDVERLRLWLFARCVQESIDQPDMVPTVARLAP